MFESAGAPGNLSGLAVLTPETYANLALMRNSALPGAIGALLLTPPKDVSDTDGSRLLAEVAEVLYSLAHVGRGISFKLVPFSDDSRLSVSLNETELVLTKEECEGLLSQPPILRDLAIAERLATVEPNLAKYMTVGRRSVSG